MQNQEMTQKIRKYKGQHVEEIEIESSRDDQTLLLFPPVDEVKFIDGVRRARQGFQRKREIVDVDGVSPIYYDNYIDSLDAIDQHVQFVYNEQGHKAFKILFNFGVIIEELEHDKNGQEIITYKYRLPREDTVQTHIPKNIQQHDDIEEYKQYIRAEIIEMQNFNLENTKQRYVAIYSMMIKVFKLQKTVVGTSMQELIQKHWEGHRQILFKNNGEYNLCYMEAIAKALHPDTQEKRYMPNNIISLAREYLVQVLDLPFKAKSREMTKYLKTFEGLDYQMYSQIITQKLQVNQNIYFYDEDSKAYYQGQKIIHMEYDALMKDEQPEILTVDILIVQASNLQHAFAIANKEALTGLKFCPFCQVKGFDTRSSKYQRDYERHVVKCEQRGGKLVKTIKLDQVQKPYVPHIVQNKTFAYLLAHGREKEFKPTQYYIIYDLETVEKIVNKSFGKSSKQISELVPLSVASTIKNKAGVRTIYYDLRNGDDFINQWLNQIFNEAVIVQQDNQYRTMTGVIDKAMQYNVDVPVIGFNSSKFDFSLIFKNLQCADWQIKSYIGSSGVAKQIVVQHKKLDVKLKFIDIFTYYVPITLKEFAKTFSYEVPSGDQSQIVMVSPFESICNQKGVFPYEYINTDNYKEILKQQVPFPIEAFNSTLKNTQITQEDYDVYVNDAKQFKNRWEYLQYYNEHDTKIMIEPINKLIEMNRKYNIDMFSFMSMAACSNATKYACTYKDFKVNDNYPVINDTSPRFVLQQQYWNSKVLSYEVQDRCQKRDTTDNVKELDFEYFKQLFKDSKCAICGDEFTMNNKPTLDRINNLKGHSKDNVQPAYIDTYKLIRKWITGGLSNVMNRVNVAGQDFIKKFQYDSINKEKLSDNVYAVQMNPEKCKCNTPLQVAYFVLDNANFISQKEILTQHIGQCLGKQMKVISNSSLVSYMINNFTMKMQSISFQLLKVICQMKRRYQVQHLKEKEQR
ncbi:MAG: hypothetical protein EZS28_028024 [Streblomastix strix]|uniref:DNA-directed DNA polymerase n=1 Tax=Streblomastix strix TaxID=222440 RepID=A0A5J4V144_9EUKA|nr:MAG: hypothetical protein EZS28_028024 [Streblomastix strix]